MPNVTPRDLLPGQVFVLSCIPGKDTLPDRRRMAYVIRAAVMGQLLIDGHLIDVEGFPERAVLSRLTDPVLEQVAGEVAGARSRTWRSWLRRRSKQTLAAVQDQLVAAGIIRTYRRRVLGIFSRTAVAVEEPALVDALRRRVTQTLDGTGPVSAQDAMLVALLVNGDVRSVISRADRRAHRDRIAELIDRSTPVAPLLKKVISSMRAAQATAATSGGS